jgi:hypothetical protein
MAGLEAVAKRIYRQQAFGRPGRLKRPRMNAIARYAGRVHRETGLDVVVRGRPGRVVSTWRTALHVPLPPSGRTVIDGHRRVVRSFVVRGFGGERLTIWLLGRP